MKDYRKSFRRAASVLVLTVTLACRFAAAQSTAPSGSYGFVVNAFQIDSNGANGGALVGIINFDGAGNVTGTATVKPRDTNAQNAQAAPTTFTGTYSSNPAHW